MMKDEMIKWVLMWYNYKYECYHTTLLAIKEGLLFHAGDPLKLFLLAGDPAALFRMTLILYLTESPNRFRGVVLPLLLLGGDEAGLVVLIAWVGVLKLIFPSNGNFFEFVMNSI